MEMFVRQVLKQVPDMQVEEVMQSTTRGLMWDLDTING